MAHTVNCPHEGCDFPIDTDSLEDGDQISCPDCGELVEVQSEGTVLTAIEPDYDDLDDLDDEEEED